MLSNAKVREAFPNCQLSTGIESGDSLHHVTHKEEQEDHQILNKQEGEVHPIDTCLQSDADPRESSANGIAL